MNRGFLVHLSGIGAIVSVCVFWNMFLVEDAAAVEDMSEECGVVVEEVGEGSALAKAGVQVGDLLLSWERLPNPSENPERARGPIDSVFDWRWLVIEQAPRGTVRLSGVRDGEPQVFDVMRGEWEAKVRPRLPENLLAGYMKGQALIAAGELNEAIVVWQRVADAVKEVRDWRLRCGLSLRMGEIWAGLREWEKAHMEYASALEAARDPRSRAVLLDDIGRTHEDQSDFEKAITSYRTALEIREKEAPGSLAVAKSLQNLGSVALDRGKLDQAIELCQHGLAIRELLAPESLELAISLNSLGWVAWQRGQLEKAMEILQRALRIAETLAPESLLVADSLSRLAPVILFLRDPEQSAEIVQRALLIQRRLAPESDHVATSLNALAILAVKRGELARAAEFHQQALTIWAKIAPDSVDVAISLNNQGNLAFERGDLARAVEFHQRALTLREKLIPKSLGVAASLNNLGNVAYEQGELDQAAEFYRRALVIKENLAPESRHVANSLRSLGNVAFARGELDQSAELDRRALAILEKTAPENLDIAANLHGQGEVALARGELNQAEEFFQRAIEILKKQAPGSDVMAFLLNGLGTVAETRGDLDQAAELYHRALVIIEAQQASGTRVLAMILSNLALIARDRGQFDLAAEYFNRSIEALEDQVGKLGGSQNVRGNFQARYGHYYRKFIEFLLDQNRPVKAFAILERSRAQSFLTLLAERDLAFDLDIPEELDKTRRRLATRHDQILHKLAGVNSARDGKVLEKLQKDLLTVRRQQEDTLEEIRRASPKLAALQYPQPLDFSEARQTLDPGTVLLSYSVGEERSDLFVVTHEGGLEAHLLPIGLDDLKRDVERLRKLIEDDSLLAHDQETLAPLSHQLYQILVAPASKAIEASERVLIVPDGPLHLLPFGALIREPGADPATAGQFLVEWKPLHFVLSSTVYAELKRERRTSPQRGQDLAQLDLRAFGDPVYPQRFSQATDRSIVDVRLRSAVERGLFDWDPLLYSRWEVEQIAELFPGAARTYLGLEATEEQAKSLGDQLRIVHFATHAYQDDRDPLSSAVVLTIPQVLRDDRDNGLLQAWEIFESVRLDADLVVLSACESALGQDQGGDGLLSLSRAFHYAGARTVLASLWKVVDRMTAELMVRFYQRLREGQSKDDALRGAQLSLIRDPIPVRNHQGIFVELDASAPYYWAAFQVYGDWQ